MITLFKDKFKTNSQRLQNWDYSSEAVYFLTIVTKDRKCIFGVIEEEKMILNENGKIVENELLKSIKTRKNWFFHNWIIMPNHIHLLIEIVETHSCASTLSISATENNTISDSNFLSETGYNDLGNSLSTYGRETHSCAPLQNQSDVNSDSNLHESHIVETHSCASTSSISTTGDNTNTVSTSSISATKTNSESKFSRKNHSISSFVAIFKSVTTRQINGSESIWQANYHDHIVRNYKRFERIYDYIKHNPRSWETDSLK
ncbi:transposase [Flavobacterium anhuiense]|uniref:transposase n=1 Tax=Flavobacterium anhuiense TaxID=459526 RepID=UPI003D98D43A